MDSPRCLPASCGDCLFRLRKALGISLALHALVLVLPEFDWTQNSGKESMARMSVTLAQKEIREMPVVLAGRGAESLSGHARLAQVSTDLRSTLKRSGKRKEAKAHEISGAEEPTILPDGADVVAYRLALGRSASRLIAAANLEAMAHGEIVFVLQRQADQVHPDLHLFSQSVATIPAERLLDIMRVAVDETPLPPEWGGRRFRLALYLQVLPNQSVFGSG